MNEINQNLRDQLLHLDGLLIALTFVVVGKNQALFDLVEYIKSHYDNILQKLLAEQL